MVRSDNMVFTQGRGFVLGTSFGLQIRSIRCRVLVCSAADTGELQSQYASILIVQRIVITRCVVKRPAEGMGSLVYSGLNLSVLHLGRCADSLSRKDSVTKVFVSLKFRKFVSRQRYGTQSSVISA